MVKNRSKLVWLVVSLLAAACSVVFGDADDFAGTRPADAGSVFDVPLLDAEADAESIPDAITRGDAAKVDADEQSLCCDCDGDGYVRQKSGCVPQDAGSYDCDDRDPLVHPGQDFVAERPEAPNAGDWNCDGRITKQLPENLQCTLPFCLENGFLAQQACGETADYYQCASPYGACTKIKTGTQTQGCK
jgi:hypothetical protein